MSTIKSYRETDASAPVTAEEAATQLFNQIMGMNREALSQDAFLALFAKCLLAVKEPKQFIDNYHDKINS